MALWLSKRYPLLQLTILVQLLISLVLVAPIHTQEVVELVPSQLLSRVVDFAKSPLDDVLAVVARNDEVYLWSIETREHVLSFQTQPSQYRRGLAWSPDGQFVAAVFEAGVYLWDTATGDLLHVFDASVVYLFVFSPDSQMLLTSSLEDEEVLVWDVTEGTVIQRLAHNHSSSAIRYMNDGSTIATSNLVTGLVYLWDTGTWQLVMTVDHGSDINDFGFSANDEMIATVGGRLTGNVRIWDTDTGELLQTLRAPLVPLDLRWIASNSLAVLFGTQMLLSDGVEYVGAAVRVWEPISGEAGPVFELTRNEMLPLNLTGDEQIVGVTRSDTGAIESALIWDRSTDEINRQNLVDEQPQFSYEITSEEIFVFDVDPDASMLVAISGDDSRRTLHSLSVWDFRTGEQNYYVALPEAEYGIITKLLWLSGGREFLSLSDSSLLLWSVP